MQTPYRGASTESTSKRLEWFRI